MKKLIDNINKVEQALAEITTALIEEGKAERSADGILLPREAGKKK